jgi:hypothetical protein
VTAGRWLAIVIAVFVLLGIGYATVRLGIDRRTYKEHENALRAELHNIRGAIAAFRKANGRYPHTLEELRPTYLRAIPVDPLTREANWRLVTEDDVQPNTDFTSSQAKTESFVIDVHSAARPPYSEW